MEKAKRNLRKYSTEFKICVILDLAQNNLSYREAVRKYWKTSSRKEEDLYRRNVRNWYRTYFKHGEERTMAKRGRPRKPVFDYDKAKNTDPEELSKEELMELVMYMQAEIDYLKKLKALVQAEEQKKKPK